MVGGAECRTLEKLDIASTLFAALGDEGVTYCHWKSNEHLGAALRGETDLDLLVHPADRELFDACVSRLGFIRVLSPRVKRFRGLEDFLGFDHATGSQLHLHVHYRLVLGEQRIKNHHLPLEDWMLTEKTEVEGVDVPSPVREFLLLYVRAMLKTPVRSIVRSALRRVSPLPRSIERELLWLAERADVPQLADAAESSGLGIPAAEIVDFRTRSLEDRISWFYVFGRKRSLLRRLRKFERHPRYKAIPRKAWLRVRYSRPIRRLDGGIPLKRLHGRAPLVAFVGADGAGKTRLTKDLEAWLRWKLEVRHVYFGQPKSSHLFKLLHKIGIGFQRIVRPRVANPAALVRGLSALQRYTDAAKWILLARRRARLASRADVLCRSGEMVIAERYPLRQFRLMTTPMDGPRLQDRTSGARPRRLARMELRSYDSIQTPDLVIALDARLSTLRHRKLDLKIEEHAAKVEAVHALRSDDRLVVIDAGCPYEDVLLQAKQAIWTALREAR